MDNRRSPSNHYRIGGLLVESQLVLHGAIRVDDDQGATPDVLVRRGAVPDTLPGDATLGPNWTISGQQFLFQVPDVARFLVTDARWIDVAMAPGVAEDEAIVFLLGTVFGVLQHMRQRMVLHASAVAVGDQAVLFCGAPGAGKSTLAAALNRKGYLCISDDVCGIDFGADRPVVLPDGRMLKLWADTVQHLELAERRGPPVRSHLEKYYVEPEGAALDRDLPVAAVYVLRPRGSIYAHGLARLASADAAVLLRRNAYQSQFIRRTGQEAAYFAWSSALQKHASVCSLGRPDGLEATPTVIGWLEAHWRSLGILAEAL